MTAPSASPNLMNGRIVTGQRGSRQSLQVIFLLMSGGRAERGPAWQVALCKPAEYASHKVCPGLSMTPNPTFSFLFPGCRPPVDPITVAVAATAAAASVAASSAAVHHPTICGRSRQVLE